MKTPTCYKKRYPIIKGIPFKETLENKPPNVNLVLRRSFDSAIKNLEKEVEKCVLQNQTDYFLTDLALGKYKVIKRFEGAKESEIPDNCKVKVMNVPLKMPEKQQRSLSVHSQSSVKNKKDLDNFLLSPTTPKESNYSS